MAKSSVSSVLEDPIVNEALDFVNNVKFLFKDNREKFDEFITIMKDSRNTTDKSSTIARVEELFKGNTDFFEKFRTFLPDEYRIKDDEPNQAEMEHNEEKNEKKQ